MEHLADQIALDQADRSHHTLDIEGRDHPWRFSEITASQVREVAEWPTDQEITVINTVDNSERTIVADEIIRLGANVAFGKKIHFKRGSR